MFGRAKRREQEREAVTAARLHELIKQAAYQSADPAEVDRHIRSRTDAPTRMAGRKEPRATAAH